MNQGETDGNVDTVNVLIAAGADVRRKDDNGNNILISAAQMCGPRIVTALIAAGAEIKLTNGGGMTPLGMALLMRHPESAEVLVSKGARLNASQVQMLNASVTDPRAKVIIQRAAVK
ncbi:MAG TPA: ankyrin repeat domain-containing protein [Casimicrobiaceae bacterium]|nr:ankyrin repeat domain-containing protein [Casimicrobiaceae bacterium]